MTSKNYYLIDTSSLIALNRRYPIDVFPTLWKKIESLINSGFLISHKEVLNEISIMDDALKVWTRNHKKMFKEITPKQIEIVQNILIKYPSLANSNNERYSADAFIIALAVELQDPTQKTLFDLKNGHLIVTEEKLRDNRVRIPFVCKDFNIECIDILEMYKKEGWTF